MNPKNREKKTENVANSSPGLLYEIFWKLLFLVIVSK